MNLKSSFKLYTPIELSQLDYKVLALLYQPLLGVTAHSVYVTLFQLNLCKNSQILDHQTLLDLLNIKHQTLIHARQHLEALNLLDVYQNKDVYVYHLKTPLTPKQFLLDTIFGSYLLSEIGEKNLSFIKEQFRLHDIDLKGFKNITKSFDELFEFKETKLLNIDHQLQGKIFNGGSMIKYPFDFETFIDQMPSRYKNVHVLTEKFKENIIKIAFVYQLSAQDMVEVYEQAHDPHQLTTFNQLNVKASQYYQKKKKGITVQEKDLSQTDIMESITPEMVVQKYGNPEHNAFALHTIGSILNRNLTSIGVLNVLVMFLMKHKEGILPPLRYLEKVIDDWTQKGIMTTEDALIHVSKLEESQVIPNHKTTKKK